MFYKLKECFDISKLNWDVLSCNIEIVTFLKDNAKYINWDILTNSYDAIGEIVDPSKKENVLSIAKQIIHETSWITDSEILHKNKDIISIIEYILDHIYDITINNEDYKDIILYNIYEFDIDKFKYKKCIFKILKENIESLRLGIDINNTDINDILLNNFDTIDWSELFVNDYILYEVCHKLEKVSWRMIMTNKSIQKLMKDNIEYIFLNIFYYNMKNASEYNIIHEIEKKLESIYEAYPDICNENITYAVNKVIDDFYYSDIYINKIVIDMYRRNIDKIVWDKDILAYGLIEIIKENQKEINWEMMPCTHHIINLIFDNASKIDWCEFLKYDEFIFILKEIIIDIDWENIEYKDTVYCIVKNNIEYVNIRYDNMYILIEDNKKDLDWEELLKNKEVIDYLKEELFDWFNLCRLPNANHIFEQHLNIINWEALSNNKNALYLFKGNLDKISWSDLMNSKYLFYILELNINYVNLSDPAYINVIIKTIKRGLKYATLNDVEDNPNIIAKLRKDLHLTFWRGISFNPVFIDFLEKHVRYINWDSLSSNPKGGRILEKYPNKINWKRFSKNKGVIHLLIKEYNLSIEEKRPTYLDWDGIQCNTLAWRLLARNHSFINWNRLSTNDCAISILMDEYELSKKEDREPKFNWSLISYNSCAMNILEENVDKINYNHLSYNDSLFTYNYDSIREAKEELNDEIIAFIFRTERVMSHYNIYGTFENYLQ